MKNIFRLLVILVFICCISVTVFSEVTFSGSAGPPTDQLSLWYRQPATDWKSQALPIGNGQFGGMVFGGVVQEHIQFNEKTLWDGSPTNYGYYQNFGDLYLNFSGLTAVTNYRRDLSLQRGLANVTYTVGSTTYTREYFCSYPDRVMVLRLGSNGSSNLNFTVSLTNAHTGGTMTASGNRITMAGTLPVVSYEAQVLVQNEGGSISTASNQITVSNANAVTILLFGGTDYSATASNYLSGIGASGLHTNITNQINTASAKSFSTLETNHLNDYQPLFNRMALSLNNNTKPSIPTDQLIANYKSGNRDPALEVLVFQYGRYMTITGSRAGVALPTNLQGIWNNSNTPGWGCDMHADINVEMNYFATDMVNLTECNEPYTDWIYNESIVHSEWKNLATSLGANGWTICVQNNIFGNTNWEVIYSQNAWLCMDLWRHYLYSLDTNYLSTKAYPSMKSACDFWLSRLKTATDGTLVAPNEYSPEHGPHEDGTSFAQQLIWDLFTNTIKASQVLNVDASYRSTLQTKLSQLDPGMHIGSWGQLREWKYTNDDPADTHRHQSYAICLYPGQQLLPLSRPDLAQAITVSLDHRGDGGDGGNGYGWDHAWKIALRARLFDGNHSYVLLQKLFTDGDFANNLFDIYGGSVFQIDANYGTMAGMAEMLLQSHAGFIHLLPALPDAWSTGSATGLCAQGAFVVGMNWSQKWITTATITSKLGGSCVVKNPLFQTGNFTLTANGSAVSYTLNGDTITFSTTAGTTYTITATGGAPTPTPTPVATPIPAGTNAVLNKTATANAYWDVQTPAKAVNGTILDTNDKWCTDQNPGAQWLKVDIGQTCNLNRWVVKHAGAGGETATLNTKDFKLQKSNDGTTWTDVDAVTGNTANITDRNVTAFSARYVQLYVTIPTQTTDVHSRIYEFEVYTVSGGATSTPTPTPAATATPTPTPAVTATPTPTSGIVSGATYKIIARHSGKLFGVNGGVTTNGATIVQQTDTSANSQKWVITDLGTGYYKIINLNSSKSLDINGGSTSDGAQAIQYTYSGSNNQQWQITDLGTGYFKILVRHSGKSLDVNGASTADGANIIQWTWSGSNNQQWQLVKQ